MDIRYNIKKVVLKGLKQWEKYVYKNTRYRVIETSGGLFVAEVKKPYHLVYMTQYQSSNRDFIERKLEELIKYDQEYYQDFMKVEVPKTVVEKRADD